MRRSILLLVPALVACGCNTAGLSAAAPTGKPEDAVKSFVDAVNKKDGAAALSVVFTENRDGTSVGQLVESGRVQLQASNFKVTMKEPYLADVTFDSSGTAGGQAMAGGSDHVYVLYTGGRWQIVPKMNMALGGQMNVSVSTMVAALDMSPVFTQAKKAAESTSSLSNAKQIATAVLMYSGDWDDRLPTAGGEVDKLMPYLKNKMIFTAPGEPAESISYSFNEQVLGKPVSTVANPATTVLLYEGKDHKLNFSHDRKAAVAFCDGHCRSVTRESESSLNWDPSK